MFNDVSRGQWASLIGAVPEDDIQSALNALSDGWRIEPKALPQSGLGMLKLRDSAFCEPFYLGEFPLSTCWVRVTTQDGHVAEGAASVMDDRIAQAERLALCDAVLSARLPGWQSIENLLIRGQRLREQVARERKAMLARTRVDFSLLDDVGDEGD